MTAWTITRQREAEDQLDTNVICHCGSLMSEHSQADNHSPVEMVNPFEQNHRDLLAAYIELAEAVERDACMGYPAGAATNHVRAFREEP